MLKAMDSAANWSMVISFSLLGNLVHSAPVASLALLLTPSQILPWPFLLGNIKGSVLTPLGRKWIRTFTPSTHVDLGSSGHIRRCRMRVYEVL